VSSLNKLYQSEPALYERNFMHTGFEWIEVSDHAQSVLVYCRKGSETVNDLLIILNLTPVPREGYRVGLPAEGTWSIIFNSDQPQFNGSDFAVNNQIKSERQYWQTKPNSGVISLPPLGGIILKREFI
jgi:1,4-alpha-glucan branching enzyme